MGLSIEVREVASGRLLARRNGSVGAELVVGPGRYVATRTFIWRLDRFTGSAAELTAGP